MGRCSKYYRPEKAGRTLDNTLTKKDTLIAIGQVTKAQGLRGEIRIKPLTDFPERFQTLQDLFLCKEDEIQIKSMESVRYANKNIIIKFKGVDTRTEAERLVGWTMKIEEHQTVELPEDTFFVHDVIGAAVFSDEETRIGRVTDVYQFPAQDLLVVKSDTEGKEHLIPIVDEFIKKIDLKEKKIIVHVLDGLLD